MDFDYLLNDYISKEKIKAKIEEVNKRENVSISDVFESMKEYAIQVLQELLEEDTKNYKSFNLETEGDFDYNVLP